MTDNDTIAAVSTPFGKGAISIVRISGIDTFSIVNKIFKSKFYSNIESPGIYIGYIIDKNNKPLDEVQLIIRKSPKSYTGEDMAEINCHGGVLVTEKVLNRVIQAGARIANPGEFSLRAVLNNKMDVTQAEAVNDIINAKTEKSLYVSLTQLNGNISNYVKSLSAGLKDILINLEVSIDHPDEDIEFVDYSKFCKQVKKIIKNINKLLSTAQAGKAFNYGVKVAFVGRANVGKSSLFNALLKKDKAIVSNIAGTTRDTIEDWIDIAGIPIKLIDTAGYKEAVDILEKLSIEKTEAAISTADIILAIFDASEDIMPEDISLIKKLKNLNIPVIYVLNKIDSVLNFAINKIQKLFDDEVIQISVLKNSGIDIIEEKLKINILGRNFNEDIIVTNVRIESLLSNAKSYLKNSLKAIDEDLPEEFIASDIKLALTELESIIGKFTTDDMLQAIFSGFCIGK